MERVTLIQINQGKFQLNYQDYLFRKSKSKSGKDYWYCVHKNSKSGIHVEQGVIVNKNIDHHHSFTFVR